MRPRVWNLVPLRGNEAGHQASWTARDTLRDHRDLRRGQCLCGPGTPILLPSEEGTLSKVLRALGLDLKSKARIWHCLCHMCYIRSTAACLYACLSACLRACPCNSSGTQGIVNPGCCCSEFLSSAYRVSRHSIERFPASTVAVGVRLPLYHSRCRSQKALVPRVE